MWPVIYSTGLKSQENSGLFMVHGIPLYHQHLVYESFTDMENMACTRFSIRKEKLQTFSPQ